MANRSYLYAADSYPGEAGESSLHARNLVGIAEWNWEVPGLAEQLIKVNPKICDSTIWDGPYAIVAEFDGGVEKALAMLDLITHPEAAEYVDKARKALTSESSRRRYFIFEPAEIFDMISDTDPIEEQLQSLFDGLNSRYGGPDYYVKRVNSATTENKDEVFREAGLYAFWNEHLYFAPVDGGESEEATPAPEVPVDVVSHETTENADTPPMGEVAEAPRAVEVAPTQQPTKPGLWQRLFGRK